MDQDRHIHMYLLQQYSIHAPMQHLSDTLNYKLISQINIRQDKTTTSEAGQFIDTLHANMMQSNKSINTI